MGNSDSQQKIQLGRIFNNMSRPAAHHLIQSSPFKPLALKSPPPVVMLSERQLYFLNLERPPPNPQKSVQLVS